MTSLPGEGRWAGLTVLVGWYWYSIALLSSDCVNISGYRTFTLHIAQKIGRIRAPAARGCANAAPAAMPPPTEAREGCSGLMGDACARQLDGGVDTADVRRPPITLDARR